MVEWNGLKTMDPNTKGTKGFEGPNLMTLEVFKQDKFV